MINFLKRLIRNYLKSRGYHLVWVNPCRTTTGFVFEYDLRRVVDLPNPVCLDIGANEGQTIRLLSRVFEQPLIHALEPTPGCFRSLSHQFQQDHIQLHQLAMGESPGVLQLNQYSHSTLNSFLPLSHDVANPYNDLAPEATVQVPVTTVDDFLTSHQIPAVHLLKTDTQGFDLHVLKGAQDSFRNGRILNVLVELNFLEMYTGQAAATEILQFLAANGLFLVDLYEKEFRQGVLGWCTGLFSIRKPRRKDP